MGLEDQAFKGIEQQSRFEELQAEQKRLDGEVRRSNGVGEKVGLPEEMKDKKSSSPLTPEAFGEQVSLQQKRVEEELSKPEHTDWPPAVEIPGAKQELDGALDAGMDSVT